MDIDGERCAEHVDGEADAEARDKEQKKRKREEAADEENERKKRNADADAKADTDANKYTLPLPPKNCVYRTVLKRADYKFCFLRPHYEQPSQPQETLEFMVVDMDTTNEITRLWDVEKKYKENTRENHWSFFVRLFGVTAKGHSVSCYLSGWNPFVYVEIPPYWNVTAIEKWIDSLENEPKLGQIRRNLKDYSITQRINIYGYTRGTLIAVLKMSFANHTSKKALCELLAAEKDAFGNIVHHYSYAKTPEHRFWLWDTAVSNRQQFVNTTKIAPSTWVSISAQHYSFHQSRLVPHKERRTRQQIDINAAYGDVCVLKDRNDIPPLLVESWDIEVMRGKRDRMFPCSATKDDELFQIGTSVSRFGLDTNTPYYCSVHCVRPTDGSASASTASASGSASSFGYHVNEYATEKDMLEDYLVFTRDKVDADIRIDFNGKMFDRKYLEDRLKMHFSSNKTMQKDYKYSDYAFGLFEYGRVRGELSECREKYGGSRAHGNRETSEVQMCGRVQLDLYQWATEEWKLNTSLNKVGAAVYEKASESDPSLKKEDFVKLDLPFYVLHEKYVATSKDRGDIAEYCAVDTQVPLRVVDVKQVFLSVFEISRLSTITADEVINKKQMARTFAKLSQYAHDNNYMMPEFPERFVLDPDLREMMFGEASYQGATVIPPHRGFHNTNVGTLDFAGLYPSIIRGFKLCYTTLILDPKWLSDSGTQYTTIRINASDDSVCSHYTLHWCTNWDPPMYGLLTDILDAREAAKKQMKAASGNPFLVALFNARQLGLKLFANSCYGYTGAKMAQLPNLAIAATVTYRGRELLMLTRDIVEEQHPECKVIYGDSVTGDTVLFLRRPSGSAAVPSGTTIIQFDELETQIGGQLFEEKWVRVGDKEYLEYADGNGRQGEKKVEVWSDGGFVAVKRFIRHKVAKKVFRVVTNSGVVDVTEDHSLLTDGKKEAIKPGELEIKKTELLHEFDDSVLLESFCDFTDKVEGSITMEEAFTCGVYLVFGVYTTNTWTMISEDKELLEKCVADDSRLITIGRKHHLITIDAQKNEKYKKWFWGEKEGAADKKGAEQKRKVPDQILRSSKKEVTKAFLDGLYAATKSNNADFVVEGKKLCTMVWILCRRLGLFLSINTFKEAPNTFLLTVEDVKKNKTVKKMWEISVQNEVAAGAEYAYERAPAEYVYDIETENHHFGVAPGALIVHNTDSVMIKFPPEYDDPRCFDISKNLAALVTTRINRKEIKLEFEKIFRGYILVGKKQYAGLKLEHLGEKPKLAVKGLAPVRGDKVEFVRRNSNAIIKTLLYERSPEKAIELVKSEMQRLVDGEIDAKELIQTKKLSKALSEYAPKQVHARVVRDMQARDLGTAPKSGEMVHYVCVEGKDKVNPVDYEHYDKNRDKYKIDTVYYIDNLCADSLGKILDFDGISDDPFVFFEPYLAQAKAKQMGVRPITSFFTTKTLLAAEDEDSSAVAEERRGQKTLSKRKIKVDKARRKNEAKEEAKKRKAESGGGDEKRQKISPLEKYLKK